MNDSMFYRRFMALSEMGAGLIVATDGAVSVSMYVQTLGLPIYPTVLVIGLFLAASGLLAFLTPVNALYPVFIAPFVLLGIISMIYVAFGGRGADMLKFVYAATVVGVIVRCTWQHPFAGKKRENVCLTFKLN